MNAKMLDNILKNEKNKKYNQNEKKILRVISGIIRAKKARSIRPYPLLSQSSRLFAVDIVSPFLDNPFWWFPPPASP
jgi:hypothetical protein